MMRYALMFVLAASALGEAYARSEDGKLGFLKFPNNGQPAIVVRGHSFIIRAQGEPDVFVDTEAGLIDMTPKWRRIPGGESEATIEIPAEFAPGFYNLVGNLNEAEDVQRRALLVLESARAQYAIAHIPSPGIGAFQEATLADAFSDETPLFLIVTGDLTASGSADEYRTLLDWLDTSSVPTLVAPGLSDSHEGRFADYFDPNPHFTMCGHDAVMAMGETAANVDEDLSGEAGAYQLLRRAMKPARWSIGISGYPPAALSARLQIVLFVDTPLDVLVTGRALANDDSPATVAWDSFQGPTRVIAPDAEDRAGIEWIRVTPAGVGASESTKAEEP